jgi:hypothetical protein
MGISTNTYPEILRKATRILRQNIRLVERRDQKFPEREAEILSAFIVLSCTMKVRVV